jgi:formylglycine-generating enzyme required for sulfatase activity
MAGLPSSAARRNRRRGRGASPAGADGAPLTLLAMLAIVGLLIGGWIFYRLRAEPRPAAQPPAQRAIATQPALPRNSASSELRVLHDRPKVSEPSKPAELAPSAETARPTANESSTSRKLPPARSFDGPLPEPPADRLAGMVLVPAGPFLYGDAEQEVDLPAFYIDRLEVSQANYAKFLEYIERSGDHSHCHPDEPAHKDHTPLAWGRPDINDPRFPVVGLDYWDVQAYAKWVGKRLPTEQEWEKAARGTDGRRFPWGDEWHADRCNWGPSGDNNRTLLPVDSLLEGASPYGCLHMLGNAAEWTASFIDEANRVHCGRGYCWRLGHMTPYVVTYRMAGQTDLRDDGSGLRCALDAPSADE